MKVISTKVHGILDYTIGAIMIAAPWLFGFAHNRSMQQDSAYGAETWVFVVLGVAALLYSMVTNYELGAWRSIPMKTHLTFDTLSGIFLALSPIYLLQSVRCLFANLLFRPDNSWSSFVWPT